MHAGISELIDEQTKGLAELVEGFRKSRVAAARKAAIESAARIKALNGRVRSLAHSGVKLTNVSHAALLDLLALQLEVVTSALSDAAAQLERVAQSDHVMDLVCGQADELRATLERVVNDLNRAVSIVRDAGRGVRDGATETHMKVAKPSKAPKAKGRRSRTA